jgi:hypothetical protein
MAATPLDETLGAGNPAMTDETNDRTRRDA